MDHRRTSFLGRPAFAALLFGLGLALFGPPLLAIPTEAGGAGLWLYMFAAWAVLIVLLLARARAVASRPPGPPPDWERG